MKAQSTPTVSRRWKAAARYMLILATLSCSLLVLAKDLGIADALNWSSVAILAGMLCLMAACSGMAYLTRPAPTPPEGPQS